MNKNQETPPALDELASTTVRLGRELSEMAHAVYIGGNSRDFGFAERTLRRLAEREPFDTRDEASLEALGGIIEGDLDRETVGSERRFVETHYDAEGQHGELREFPIYSERGETLLRVREAYARFTAARNAKLGQTPQDRRTLMFSATVPPAIAKLAGQFQRDAVRLTTLSDSRQHADIAYQALRVAPIDAENAIINVLRYHDARNAIVFANTRSMVNRLTARLSNRGFAVVALSGELSQTERTHALQAMRDGRARVCVATDVAARGIDLPNLELVVHAELPSNADGLLHRSGRTGRAGRKGTSVLIVPPKIARKAERLLNMAKIQAEWTVAPSADEILRRDEERLLGDPVWSEEITEEQDTFAAKLLALHAPERIAAAYLRLYRSRQSAPEDLSPPDARPAPKLRPAFDGSTWFVLSVGRDDRAEARWLLPLICRAGNVDKQAIGAIRVQQAETFVEISAESAPGFLATLDGRSELEKGITIRQIEAPSNVASPVPGHPTRATQKQNDDGAPKRSVSVSVQLGPAAEAPEEPSARDIPAKPHRKPRHDRAAKAARPEKEPVSRDRQDAAARPKFGGKRTGEGMGKPRAVGRDRSDTAKSGRKRTSDRFAAGSDASDTSKRFTPPGKEGSRTFGKPGGRTRNPRSGSDGTGPPRRGKR